MSWDPRLTDLQTLLADLYQEDADIRRVVTQSGIPTEHIAFNGNTLSIWHRILVEARKRDKIQALIEIVGQEYPERAPALASAAEEIPSPGAPAEPRLFNVPQGVLSSFIGRKAELQKMDELFQKYQHRMTPFFLVISGKGGIGKTKLADCFAVLKKDEIKGHIYKIEINSLDIKTGIRKLAEFFDLDRREEIDNQIQKCLQQIPPDSILIIDNVGKYDGYEILLGMQPKVFVILTTQSTCLSPFRELGNAENEHIQLSEFSSRECDDYFKAYVNAEVEHRFYQEGYRLTDFLTQKDQRSPFFIKLICRLIEEIYFESGEADIRDIKERIDHEFKKADTVTERLCKYPFERVSESAPGKNLLFASTLFASGKMPVLEVLSTAGIDIQDQVEPIQLCRKLGFISHVFTEGGREYFVMHDIFRAFIAKRFEREAAETKSQFNQRFILAWLNFLIHNQNFQELWGMHENIHSAIRLYCLLEEDSAIINTVRVLDSSHLEILEKILPPKQRNRFLFRLLENETDLEKIAHAQRGLATSFLRLGRFILAENFARQSLANFEKLQNEELQASLLRRLGNIYRSTGSYKESIQSCRKALEMFRKQRDLLACADVQRQLAQTYLEMGVLRKAEDLLIDSISTLENLIHQQGPNPNLRNSLAYTLTTLGDTQLMLGDLHGALQSVERAKSIHEQEVGPDHFYVAYDLRYLAKIEIQLDQIAAALAHLTEALKINQKFSGESPNVAFIYLMMAEAQLKAGDCIATQKNAERALKIYRRETGKNNQFIAYADRILAEASLHQGRFTEAENFIREAYQILEEKYSDSRHMSEVKFVRGLIDLQRGKIAEAEALFWQVRSDFIRFSMLAKIKEVDRSILQAILRRGSDDWDDSVSSYVKYLKDFPASLHNTLGQRLVALLLEEIRAAADESPRILDVFCGSGFVSQHLIADLPSNARVAGVDGSKLMIVAARKWQSTQDEKIFQFYALPDEYGALSSSGRFKYLTIHMGISQIDLRSRHFLFQRLLPSLAEDCAVFFSTYAADYRFSDSTDQAVPAINQNNPFKQTLFERFQAIGYEPGDYSCSIAPIYTKEDWHSLACFFEFYGFEITPNQERTDNILCVERSWKDRVEFTRLPVISKKVFGHVIPEDQWSQLGDVPDYSDMTYGIVIKARRIKNIERLPVLFSHVDIDFRNGNPIHYAVAALLKNRAGKTLFLKRGKGARDFKGSWSLPSTFADEGSGLLGSLYESLERNLGIVPQHLGTLTPRSIRFNLRKDKTGAAWTMAMCLFEATYDGKLELKSDKYQSFVWEDGPEFVNTLNSNEMGDCTKSYRDLLRCGELD